MTDSELLDYLFSNAVVNLHGVAVVHFEFRVRPGESEELLVEKGKTALSKECGENNEQH